VPRVGEGATRGRPRSLGTRRDEYSRIFRASGRMEEGLSTTEELRSLVADEGACGVPGDLRRGTPAAAVPLVIAALTRWSWEWGRNPVPAPVSDRGLERPRKGGSQALKPTGFS